MEEQNNQQSQHSQPATDPQSAEPKNDDVEKNKGIALAAYLVFFLPLIIAKDSAFARYHANQGLVLFLTAVAINIVGSVFPYLVQTLILPLGGLAILVLAVIGMVNAWGGEKKPLPLIGHFEILK